MKIWTRGSSPRNGSQNAWTRIKNFNSAIRLSNFGIFLVWSKWISFRDWWPWTKPVKCKNPLENFSPRFFWIKTASSSLIIFQRAKLSTRSIIHLFWCNWRTFWRKNNSRGKVTNGVLFLHENVPAHKALATQKKLAYLDFQCLYNPPYSLDLAPSDYHLFAGLKKNNWKVAIFRPTRRSLLPRRPGWTDNLLTFFWVVCKS